MEDPFVYQLSQIRWGLFGTLTFKGRVPPKRVQVTMFFSLMRKICRRQKSHFKHSVWCLRIEQGEAFGRWHLHFLLSDRKPSNCISPAKCFWIMDLWKKLGGGHARVRVFNRSLAGVDYTLKGMDGADEYESAKFGGSELILSHGLQRKLEFLAVKTESFAGKLARV